MLCIEISAGTEKAYRVTYKASLSGLQEETEEFSNLYQLNLFLEEHLIRGNVKIEGLEKCKFCGSDLDPENLCDPEHCPHNALECSICYQCQGMDATEDRIKVATQFRKYKETGRISHE